MISLEMIRDFADVILIPLIGLVGWVYKQHKSEHRDLDDKYTKKVYELYAELKSLKQKVNELQEHSNKQDNEIRIHLAENYVSTATFKETMADVKTILLRMEDKIELLQTKRGNK